MNVAEAPALDPGADRAGGPGRGRLPAVPGGQTAGHQRQRPAGVRQRRHDLPGAGGAHRPRGLAPKEILRFGPAYERAVAAGYQATSAALDGDNVFAAVDVEWGRNGRRGGGAEGAKATGP